MDIYDKIDGLLKEQNMSRRKLASLLGVPQSTLTSAFKNRSKTFSGEQLARIAEIFDAPIRYFLTDDEDEWGDTFDRNMLEGALEDYATALRTSDDPRPLEAITDESTKILRAIQDADFSKIDAAGQTLALLEAYRKMLTAANRLHKAAGKNNGEMMTFNAAYIDAIKVLEETRGGVIDSLEDTFLVGYEAGRLYTKND